MSVFIGLFWSLFINDMIGDKYPNSGIATAVVMQVWCPFVFILTKRLLSSNASLSSRDTVSHNNGSFSIGSFSVGSFSHNMSIRSERIAWYVHSRIWRYVLRLGTIEQSGVKTTDTDKNSIIEDIISAYNTDVSRDSYLEQTTSPLVVEFNTADVNHDSYQTTSPLVVEFSTADVNHDRYETSVVEGSFPEVHITYDSNDRVSMNENESHVESEVTTSDP